MGKPYLFDFRGGQHHGTSRGAQAQLTETEIEEFASSNREKTEVAHAIP